MGESGAEERPSFWFFQVSLFEFWVNAIFNGSPDLFGLRLRCDFLCSFRIYHVDSDTLIFHGCPNHESEVLDLDIDGTPNCQVVILCHVRSQSWNKEQGCSSRQLDVKLSQTFRVTSYK